MSERRHRSSRPRKDRLIQTRVPRDLEQALKRQAEQRRLSVSHLIRNVLEDAFDLVDGVIEHVDVLVADSQDLGRQVRRDARDLARRAQGVGRRTEPGEEPSGAGPDGDSARADRPSGAASEGAGPQQGGPQGPAGAPAPQAPAEAPLAAPRPYRNLDHILAWNPVTLNRAAQCSGCAASLARGEPAHLGVAETPGSPPEWLCDACLRALD